VPIVFPVTINSGSVKTILFCNIDNRLLLWVNNKLVETRGSCYSRPEKFYPTSSDSDPGDAQPCGIAVKDSAVSVARLKVLRDVYYVSRRGVGVDIKNETGYPDAAVQRLLESPDLWASTEGKAIFDASIKNDKPMFSIPEGCYFPMGDNSPESKDGRVWEGPNYFTRDLLIGRAMLVYWPHGLNYPVPFTPNFSQMRPIR
jgi:signal peptidase I